MYECASVGGAFKNVREWSWLMVNSLGAEGKKEVEEVDGQRDGNNRDKNRIRDRKNLWVVSGGTV